MRLLFLFLLIITQVQISTTQELELPRKSPQASTNFTVGLTDITIDYSSPAVRDRVVWGNLVNYDQLWRAGANEATTIEFSRDILIQGEHLKAGKYAFFLVPTEKGDWTAIFNTQIEQWGAYDYDEKNDALRVKVAVDTLCAPEERLQYYLSDTDLDAGTICMRWEHRSVCLAFSVPVLAQIEEQLQTNLAETPEGDAWRLYAEVADFLKTYDNFRSHALSFAIQSTAQFDDVWNWWLRAQIEQDLGDLTSAIVSAEKALKIGETSNEKSFYQRSKPAIENAIANWRKQMD